METVILKFYVRNLINFYRTVTPLANNELISLVEWSPVDSSIIYILNNDIYYHQLINNRIETRRITFDGQDEIFFNGIADWVYEGNF